MLCNLSNKTLRTQQKLDRLGLPVTFTLTPWVETQVFFLSPSRHYSVLLHPDTSATTSREYSQSSYQDNGYEKWTALTSQFFLIWEKKEKLQNAEGIKIWAYINGH